MGVVFFSSLAMICGGALLKRNWARRKILRRYALRVAEIVENNAEIQAYFRAHPEAVLTRERRLCGKPVEIELSLFERESAILVAVTDPNSVFNNCRPVTERVDWRYGN